MIKVKIVLRIKFQDKTKSKPCDCAIQNNDSAVIKKRASILEHAQCNMGIFTKVMQVNPLPLSDFSCILKRE